MFRDLIDFPIESNRLHWEARLVVRDIDQEPHLFLRLKLTGTYFPQRAQIPFVAVGKVRARLIIIPEDGLSVRAYFDEPLPLGGKIVFGYGPNALLRFSEPFNQEEVSMLDAKRLPTNIQNINRFY
jgi:hypothetical protein